MPIYEYTCEICHKTQEIIQKFNDDVPESCKECHAKGSLKKAVTTSAFHLKGGGWYKDLYSSNKKPEPAKKPATEKNDATASEAPKKPPKKEE